MLELGIAVLLIGLNGLFALSELAIVSARKARLKTMADAGRAGASTALRLAEDPGRFLSTVQIGITLVGILAGAFSGAALGDRLTEFLLGQGMPERAAEPLGYGLVIGSITYLSVVVGELVPKHLALKNAEGIACAVAPLMALISRIAAPVVWLLDASTKLIFRLLGQSTESESAVTEEEIRTIMAEAETAGVIETDERKMIAGVMRLGDRAVRGVMTPRMDVDWINLDDTEFEIRETLINTPHSRLPVAEGHPDNMLGVVQARELLAAFLREEPLDIRAHIRKAPIIPNTLDALDALEVLRQAEVPMALVHDKYGHFDGVVTPADILDAIAGAFRSDEGEAEPEAVQREDGSWLLAGWMPADEMAEQLGVSLPERRNYETVAGLVIGELQHLPIAGEAVETLGWRFEVVDLDGRRIDKVLASRIENREAA
ncbi:HlyC/CorC family transporter [Microvirga sp. 3-52]|uniref:hemolysin family protein n=1 Tax=Microvirga sp. 3-52 TaxID=2792425 RepID=UPI001ACD7CEB|nr:hemolysin family protein [Microvirga sp. 3-52]MBO1909351.1 HlyC/CorC family transporter [Microvirga sp. 3-52]MBS7455422.1 HlyC/CorC family transporter [Microvirga sp. 3-52]